MTLLGIPVSKISYLNQIFAAREVLKVFLQDHITIELGLSMRPFLRRLKDCYLLDSYSMKSRTFLHHCEKSISK